jgi:hypothetical protein
VAISLKITEMSHFNENHVEGPALLVEVLTFWIEERACRISKGYGPSFLGLRICEVLHR